METRFYWVETADRTEQIEQASGDQGALRYVGVPRRRAPVQSGGGKVIDFSDYWEARQEKEKEAESGRPSFAVIVDLCVSAAIVAVLVLVLIRFFML